MENKPIGDDFGIKSNYQDLGAKGDTLSKLEKLTQGVVRSADFKNSMNLTDSKLDCDSTTRLNAKLEASSAKTKAKFCEILESLHADLQAINARFDKVLHGGTSTPNFSHGNKMHEHPLEPKHHILPFTESHGDSSSEHHHVRPRIER